MKGNLGAYLLLLAGVGVPAVSGAAFHDWAFQHPLPAVCIFFFYELLVVVTGLVRDVWAKRRPVLVDWIDLRVRWFFSRYYRTYRRHLLARDRYMDVKGAGLRGEYALKLEEVFVELSMLPRLPEDASPNPVAQLPWQRKPDRVPKPLPQGRHPIWEDLRSDTHLAILGAPGSGKTTLLYNVAQTLLQRSKRHKVQVHSMLPILIFLRHHWQAITDNPDLSLPEMTDALLKKQRHPAPQGWFEHQLKQGRCLVLLDGLDEVADLTARQQVAHWVEVQIQNYGQNRFVLTSRPHGYPRERFGSFSVLEVQSFTGEQIEQFITNWYLANAFRSGGNRLDASLRMGAERDAKELLSKLHATPELLELAVNPLLLTMIAVVHRYGGGLPGSRVDLYAKACGVFTGGRQQSKEIPLELKPEQMQGVLQPLAFYLMCIGKLVINAAETKQAISDPLARVAPKMDVDYFLKLAENTSGLLLEQSSGAYGFAHKTFQEYLAAIYIKEQRLEQELLRQVGNEWWHETIRLYVAQADATMIIQACLAAQPLTPTALALALECMEERPAVDPAVRTQVQTLLEQGVEDADPKLRRVVAEARLTHRLRRQMARLDENRYVATSLLTCAEYQLFLDEQRAKSKWRQPDHWQAERFHKGQGHDPVLGVRFSDAAEFCAWLTAREGGEWCYRLPRTGEVAPEQRDQALDTAMKHGNGYWYEGGIEYLKNLPVKRFFTRETLSKQLSDDIDLASDLARTLDRSRALDLDFARARALNREIVVNFDRIFNRDLNLNRDLSHVFDLAPTSDSFRDFDLSGTLDSALIFNIDPARARARDLNSNIDPDRNRARALAHTLAHTHLLARKRSFESRSYYEPYSKEGMEYTRRLIRFATLALANMLLWQVDHPYQTKQGRKRLLVFGKTRHTHAAHLLEAADAYLDLYVAYAMLEARIQRMLQPFEGILLVRERQKGLATQVAV